MSWRERPKPQPGKPILRDKPYIWATWLAKAMQGDGCLRALWFRSRYEHAKAPDADRDKLVEWNREHSALMRDRRLLMEENGYQCQTERPVKLEGRTAIVAGKEDLVAMLGSHTLVIDGKTGRPRDSDFYQVAIYLWVRVEQARAAKVQRAGRLAGEVFYKGGQAVDITLDHVRLHEPEILRLIQVVASPNEPGASPGKYECGRCSVRREDCPKRWTEETEAVSETAAF